QAGTTVVSAGSTEAAVGLDHNAATVTTMPTTTAAHSVMLIFLSVCRRRGCSCKGKRPRARRPGPFANLCKPALSAAGPPVLLAPQIALNVRVGVRAKILVAGIHGVRVVPGR